MAGLWAWCENRHTHCLAASVTGVLVWKLNSQKRRKRKWLSVAHFTQHPTYFTTPANPKSGDAIHDFQMKELISELGGTEDRNSPDSQVRFRKPVFLRGNRRVSWEKILGLYHSSLAGPCLPHHWESGPRGSNTKVRSRDRTLMPLVWSVHVAYMSANVVLHPQMCSYLLSESENSTSVWDEKKLALCFLSYYQYKWN